MEIQSSLIDFLKFDESCEHSHGTSEGATQFAGILGNFLREFQIGNCSNKLSSQTWPKISDNIKASDFRKDASETSIRATLSSYRPPEAPGKKTQQNETPKQDKFYAINTNELDGNNDKTDTENVEVDTDDPAVEFQEDKASGFVKAEASSSEDNEIPDSSIESDDPEDSAIACEMIEPSVSQPGEIIMAEEQSDRQAEMNSDSKVVESSELCNQSGNLPSEAMSDQDAIMESQKEIPVSEPAQEITDEASEEELPSNLMHDVETATDAERNEILLDSEPAEKQAVKSIISNSEIIANEIQDTTEQKSHLAEDSIGSGIEEDVDDEPIEVNTAESAEIALSEDAADVEMIVESNGNEPNLASHENEMSGRTIAEKLSKAASKSESAISATEEKAQSSKKESGSFSGNGMTGGESKTSSVNQNTMRHSTDDPIKSMMFSRILEKAHLFKNNQQQTLSIKLNPEYLGKLDMSLVSRNGTVSAKICAENQMVKSKLEEMAPVIKENLAAQGIEVAQISVDISFSRPDDNNAGNSFETGTKNHSGHNMTVSEDISSDEGKDVLTNLRKAALNIYSVDLKV